MEPGKYTFGKYTFGHCLGALWFSATGDRVPPRGEVACTVNRAQREGTRSHSSFTVFLVRGFHVTRRDRGLDVRGEAQERSRDGEGTAAEGGTGRRRATTEPVAGQPGQSLADVGSHKLCFKQENNLIVGPQGTHCLGSLKTQKEQGRDEYAPTTNVLVLKTENQKQVHFQIGN